ncbi:CaiB/BaiF CoA transferase family protein [Piscinibacter sp.]|uniref:CaiB/BaiF CoA transferase family protein n=1 Tax=Piscinibacter sp. TaxID=1903157 RepID=UPI002BD1ACEC|nr:CaiB/BaiF CoA-transferase family protein [Albitalea sp.]HUG25879.1 CaiB/BaiF CoA-transferase family protein [Albitalea sp.]
MTLPLAGMRVIDFTRLLPGPLATRHLLELGAEVIKVEGPPEQGQDDGTRHMGRTADDIAQDRDSLTFRLLNEGKQLRQLDLREAAGRDAALALARDADVLIEGFRPGVMQRLGLGWDVLHAANPRLVVCAITGYGQQGPWSQRAGHDINYIAMAGVLEQIATSDGDIAVPNFQIGDLLGGTQAALCGVLAALVGALRTGRGRFVDISMAHEVLRHHVLAAATLSATGRVPLPGRDMLSGGAPCYGVYRTADGRHLAVGALELKFWRALCGALDRPRWAHRHWSLGERPGGDEAMRLRTDVAALFASQPLNHWVKLFDTVDCCVTPVLRLDEAHAHPLFT